MKKIILASESPAKKMLLEKIGLEFETESSNYKEDINLKLEPKELVKFLSQEKAKAVAKKHNNAIIIGADTVVALDNEIIGKSHTEEKAKETLQKLSGKLHSIITGFTIINTETNKTISKVIETKVYFRTLSEQEIESYVKKEQPLKHAGSYKIQDLGSILVEKIEGDYSNIMGLPLTELTETLKKEFGIDVL